MALPQPEPLGPSDPAAVQHHAGTALEPVLPAGSAVAVRDADPLDGELVESRSTLPPALTEAASPLTLLQALRRRWLHAVPLGLALAVLAGGLVWFLRPERYTASALLRITASEQKLLQDNANPQPLDRTNQYQKTQVNLIKSRKVIRKALQDPKIRTLALVKQQGDPVDWLERELKVEIIENTELVKISLSARHDERDLAPIVAAVQDAYIEVIVKNEDIRQNKLLDDMVKIYASKQEELRGQREALRKLADTLQTSDSQILTHKQKNLLEEYASLKRELAGVQSRLRDARVKLAGQRVKLVAAGAPRVKDAAADGTPLQAAVDREVAADPLVLKQLAEVYKLEEQIAQIDRVAANPNGVLRLERKQKLEAARVVLEKVRKERREAVAARLGQALQSERALQARETEEELKVLEKQREALQAEVTRVGREVARMGGGSIELELMRNDIEQTEVVLRALRNQKDRLEVELRASARGRVFVDREVEEATVLNKKGRLLESSAAAFAGLFLGLFGVSYREFRRRKIYTPAEVARGLRMRVMGTVPALPSAKSTGNGLAKEGAEDWNLLLQESVDAIRTLLLQGRPRGASSVLLIASACSGEGKTTLAGLLAASLARAGRRTLLVDGDLRRPSLHRLFGVKRTPGLCELLTGSCGVEDAVRPTPVDRLQLLAAGQYSPEAATALAGAEREQVFRELRDRYEFVVVDSSPVLAVPDALMLGNGADGVVFSLRPGVSEAPQVHAAHERLRELGLPVLGTVINGVKDRATYAHNYRYLSASAAD